MELLILVLLIAAIVVGFLGFLGVSGKFSWPSIGVILLGIVLLLSHV